MTEIKKTPFVDCEVLDIDTQLGIARTTDGERGIRALYNNISLGATAVRCSASPTIGGIMATEAVRRQSPMQRPGARLL